MLPAMRGLALALVLAVARVASAEPPEPVDSSEAAQLFLRGRELVKLGQRAEACELFDRSYKLDPAPGTGINLAVCLEQQGQLRRAWELFDRVARSSPNVQSRVTLARQRADALVKRLAVVVVVLGGPIAPGLEVRLGDRELTVVPSEPRIRAVVEPGFVELVAAAPGQPAYKATVNAVEGAEVTAEVPPLVALQRSAVRVYVAGGLGAVGVAGLGVSLGFALAARDANQAAFDHGCARTPAGVVCTAKPGEINQGGRLIHLAGTRADIATGFAIAGAAVVVAAAVVFVVSREPADAVQVAPLASAEALGVGIAGRF